MSRTNTPRDDFRLPAGALAGRERLFWVVGLLGLILSGVGFATDRGQFFHSYLTAFVFTLTIALGCLFFVMVNHLARSGWNVVLRRQAEVAAWTLPVFALLFLPLLGGMHDLFHWTHHDAVEHDALLQHKSPYLNTGFFIVRAVIYFGVWSLLGFLFMNRSLKQDTDPDPKITTALQRMAAPGILLFAFTITFAAFDWLMSLDPHWYSTIFGVYIFAGAALAAHAVITLHSLSLRARGILDHTIRVDHYQDLGRWLFAFSVFWAYIGFSQFFLIWYGNIPEETAFFVHRMEGGWGNLSYFLAAGQFAVPFVLLMSRWVKRRPAMVGLMALWILVVHYLDVFWMVMPNYHHELRWSWMDLTTVLGVMGIFLAVFTRKLAGGALVAEGDPRLPESMHLEHLY